MRDLENTGLLIRRLLNEISKLDGGIPEASGAMGVSPDDITKLANGRQLSREALEAIRSWLDERVILSQPEKDDYDRLWTAARQTLAVVLSSPAARNRISSAISKVSYRELVSYTVALLAVALVVGIIIGVVLVHPTSAAPTAAPSATLPTTPPAGPSSAGEGASSWTATADPVPTTTPTATPSTALTPDPGGAPVVYQDIKIHIPAMAQNESAGVTFAPPAVDLNTGSDDDLEYFNTENADNYNSTQSWNLGDGDSLASIGTRTASAAACRHLLTTDPMDLNTKNLEQGQGYCIQIADGRIGYFKVLFMAQGNENGNSGPVVLALTLWQS
jgi:hypothetical protein